MPKICATSTNGGKGNFGKFYEREPRICAAGIPTAQEREKVSDVFTQHKLIDEVDALLNDAIMPSSKPKPLPPLRKPMPLDMRFAFNGNLAQLVNPPMENKLQTLITEIKNTAYQSYWKNTVGKSPDYVSMVPLGFDSLNKTMGMKTPFHGRLYDLITPKEPLPDKTSNSMKPGIQTQRNYRPPFDSNLIYGYKTNVNKRGGLVKCAMTDEEILLGTSDYALVNTVQYNFKDKAEMKIGKVCSPNQNIEELPKDHCFGKLIPPGHVPECLSQCDLKPNKDFFKKCIGYLNSVRKILSKSFLPTFFYNFYLHLKFVDKNKTGWLPKDIVYKFCVSRLIRFDSKLIEPLLAVLNAFDGKYIKYKTLVLLLNYREPLTGFPKVHDLPDKCIEYRTTYGEMTKPGQKPDERLMAGIPSGRYLDRIYPVTPDNYCRADNAYLPHESDMKCCLNPSIMINMNVSHRDMFAKRDESTIKKVFEASGETFTEEEFNDIYKIAKQYHPRGWVCYETFRRALQKQ